MDWDYETDPSFSFTCICIKPEKVIVSQEIEGNLEVEIDN